MNLSGSQFKRLERVVIFDLDGTLIDSSAGILSSLEHAFSANGVSPTDVLSNFMIGPPVCEIVESLSPGIDAATKNSVIEYFKRRYDSSGYLQSVPYDGIDQMLTQLLDSGTCLAIVTNKRERPTKLIVNRLGWNNYFSNIYCPDSVQPSSPCKAALIKQLLRDAEVHPLRCVYIGDRMEDWHSARVNGIRFGWAKWGYSNQMPDFDDDSFILTAPDKKMILAAIENPPRL